MPFLAIWKINPQLHSLPNHWKNMRNKGFNDLSSHVEPKDLPPKPLLQHLRYIKNGRKHTTVHPHTIDPSKTPSSSYYPLQKEKKPKKVFCSFLMDFQSPTPYPTLTSPKHHPPSSFPYLSLIIMSKRHLFQWHTTNSICTKAPYLTKICWAPNLSLLFSKHIVDHFRRFIFFSKPPPPHRKSLSIFSNLNLTILGIWNKDIK